MAKGENRGKDNFVVTGDYEMKFPQPKWIVPGTKNRQDILIILVAGLIIFMGINFFFDYSFREMMNTMHDSVTSILLTQYEINLKVEERIEIIFDELFDRIWEDTEQA